MMAESPRPTPSAVVRAVPDSFDHARFATGSLRERKTRQLDGWWAQVRCLVAVAFWSLAVGCVRVFGQLSCLSRCVTIGCLKFLEKIVPQPL